MQGKETESHHNLQFQELDKTPESWEKVSSVLGSLNETEFGMPPASPILGESDDIVAYSDLKDAVLDPQTVVVTASDNDRVIGYTLAMPIDKMSPSRQSESRETAYIYFTAIVEEMRGKGIVGSLADNLFEELVHRGYSYVERDAVLKYGYADSIQRHYEKYPGSIVSMEDHTKFPEIGPQRFFRIDLQRYLSQQTS